MRTTLLALAALAQTPPPRSEPPPPGPRPEEQAVDMNEVFTPIGTLIPRRVNRLTTSEREAVRVPRQFGACTVRTKEAAD